MEAQFWHQKWDENKIGFHQSDVNESLTHFWPALVSSAERGAENVKSCVFVPMCGKSLDMLWLLQQGHQVLGVELSEKAAQAFFTDNSLDYKRLDEAEFVRFSGTGKAQGVDILAGDFFKLTVSHTASCSWFYDRASLVAMKPDMRADYTRQLAMLTPAGSCGLLVTMSYDQARMQGPPFSVSAETVSQLLSETFQIEELAHYTGPDRVGTLSARGLESIDEWVHLLTRK